MLRIILLEGDETGQELLEQALRVLDPEVVSRVRTKIDVWSSLGDSSSDPRRSAARGV
jgi:isocitrate/isopropylmalate dehydrogenase